jgi:hypothetical protein
LFYRVPKSPTRVTSWAIGLLEIADRSPVDKKINQGEIIMYTIQSGNIISISDRVEMFTTTSPNTRQCYVRAPYLFNERPVVTLTVSTEADSYRLLIVWAVEAAPATGETMFKVSAQFEQSHTGVISL